MKYKLVIEQIENNMMFKNIKYKLVNEQFGGIKIVLESIIHKDNQNVYITGAHGLTDLNLLYAIPDNTYIVTLVNVGKSLDGSVDKIYQSKDIKEILNAINVINRKTGKPSVNIYGPGEILFMPSLNFSGGLIQPGYKCELPIDGSIRIDSTNPFIKKETTIQFNLKRNKDLHFTNEVMLFNIEYYTDGSVDEFNKRVSTQSDFLNHFNNKSISEVITLFKQNDFLLNEIIDTLHQECYLNFDSSIIFTLAGLFKLPYNKSGINVRQQVTDLIDQSEDIRLQIFAGNLIIELKSHDVIWTNLKQIYTELYEFNPFTASFHVARYLMNYKKMNLNELIDKIIPAPIVRFGFSSKTHNVPAPIVIILGNCRNYVGFENKLNERKEVKFARSLSINTIQNDGQHHINKSFLLLIMLLAIYQLQYNKLDYKTDIKMYTRTNDLLIKIKQEYKHFKETNILLFETFKTVIEELFPKFKNSSEFLPFELNELNELNEYTDFESKANAINTQLDGFIESNIDIDEYDIIIKDIINSDNNYHPYFLKLIETVIDLIN